MLMYSATFHKSDSFIFKITHIIGLRSFKSRNFNRMQINISVFQGRAVGVVAGATRAFGRRTQGVWGAGPPTAGGELSGY